MTLILWPWAICWGPWPVFGAPQGKSLRPNTLLPPLLFLALSVLWPDLPGGQLSCWLCVLNRDEGGWGAHRNSLILTFGITSWHRTEVEHKEQVWGGTHRSGPTIRFFLEFFCFTHLPKLCIVLCPLGHWDTYKWARTSPQGAPAKPVAHQFEATHPGSLLSPSALALLGAQGSWVSQSLMDPDWSGTLQRKLLDLERCACL